ncbi:hypothetical protein LCGC14_0763780 [marine sediment metagenome]|uniref:Uncharacterized protein n=1 Tax=marine sediment metagenome TaxID=412755 RepID=A0A0F9Q4J1_9ZZZZ
MELKIESEKVLALAKKRPGWRAGLKELIPKAFESDKYFNLSSLGDSDGFLFSLDEAKAAGFESRYFLKVAHLFPSSTNSELNEKAFYLGGLDNNLELRPIGSDYLLIPTRKD